MGNKELIERYNGDVKIWYNDGDHSYRLETEEKTLKGTPKLRRLKGVTTFIGIKDKPALQQWYADMSIKSIVANLEYIQAGKGVDEFLEEARLAAKNYKDEAADRGKAIHKWIEEYVSHKLGNGAMPAMPTENFILLGVSAFQDWVEQNKVEFVWTERMVYSKEHDYVGTADLCVMIGDKFYLVDLKTSNSLWSEVCMQTAAYLKADQEECGENYDGRIALRISKETEEEYMKRMNEKKYYIEWIQQLYHRER